MKRATEITKKRQKELGYEPLKPNQVRVYQLIGVKSEEAVREDANGNMRTVVEIKCPVNRQIHYSYSFLDYDSEKGTNLTPEQIVFIDHEKFNREGEVIPVMGTIFFTKEERGTKRLFGNKPSDVALDAFLFFHPAQEANKEKEGFRKPRYGYVFKLLDSNKTADDLFAKESRIADAVQAIKGWEDLYVKQVAEALTVTNEIRIPAGAQVSEIKMELTRLAKKNPERILTLSQDEAIHVLYVIKTAQKMGKIFKDVGSWKWSDSKSMICVIPSGIRPEEALKSFVLDYGNKEVLDRLEDLIGEPIKA
jgi:hypothetical protein